MKSYGFRTVDVQWLDSSHGQGWYRPGREAVIACTVISRGFIIHEDREHLVISDSVCDPKEFHRPCSRPITIPKRSIVNIRRGQGRSG